LALNTPVSEGLRALAEKNIAQAREAYEHSKDALEAGLEILERSLDALGQGATALNHKVMDIASIPASTLRRAWRVQRTSLRPSAYWRKQFGALAAQAEEVRSLSTQLAADAVKPTKEQLTRSMDKLRKAG
jgi:hypothetical protein